MATFSRLSTRTAIFSDLAMAAISMTMKLLYTTYRTACAILRVAPTAGFLCFLFKTPVN